MAPAHLGWGGRQKSTPRAWWGVRSGIARGPLYPEQIGGRGQQMRYRVSLRQGAFEVTVMGGLCSEWG